MVARTPPETRVLTTRITRKAIPANTGLHGEPLQIGVRVFDALCKVDDDTNARPRAFWGSSLKFLLRPDRFSL